MAEYQLTSYGVYRKADSLLIPEESGNRDWNSYLVWLNDGGIPDPLAPDASIKDAERAWRNSALETSEWLVVRHRDQIDNKSPKAVLSDKRFSELLEYRQALRDWPVHQEFPDEFSRPKEPEWLESELYPRRTRGK